MKLPLVLAVAAVMACVLGCSLERPALDRDFFVLGPVDASPVSTASDAPVVRVARARIAEPFGSRAFQYRVNATKFTPRYYTQWADDPGTLISTRIARALGSEGSIRTVDEGSPATAPTLDIYVDALYADVRDGRTHAVIALRLSLIDANGTVDTAGEYTHRTSVPDGDVDALVEAWSKSLAEFAAAFRRQFIE